MEGPEIGFVCMRGAGNEPNSPGEPMVEDLELASFP